jgi:hypothetical protein
MVYSSEILDIIITETANRIRLGETPHVIFDLDDTIFDAGSRTRHILTAFAERPDIKKANPELSQRLARLTNDDMRYRVEDNLDLLGVSDPRIRSEATKAWWDRFFLMCEIDEVVPGAPDFVNALHSEGATIVYLTGRDRIRMGSATHASLAKQGFPHGERAQLILKPESSMCDFRFKREEVFGLAATDLILAAFDNEPRHVNMMKETIPEAHVVFVDRRHAGHPETPIKSIAWIKDFRQLAFTK